MASRREITKKFAREYATAGKMEKGRLLDELVHATGWTRDHARRAIRSANARTGATHRPVGSNHWSSRRVSANFP